MTFQPLLAVDDFNGRSPLHHIFSAGSMAGSRLYFDINIVNDHIVEKDEQFEVRIYDPSQYLKVHINKTIVEIKDDDSK